MVNNELINLNIYIVNLLTFNCCWYHW